MYCLAANWGAIHAWPTSWDFSPKRTPCASCPQHWVRIASALSSVPTLLILDNCEHVIEPAAALAAELLSACPEQRDRKSVV